MIAYQYILAVLVLLLKVIHKFEVKIILFSFKLNNHVENILDLFEKQEPSCEKSGN